jgi:hypothetical protein
MTAGGRRFLRENAFLVAAVSLPVVVVGFFLLSSFVPRWLVPPPAYDLLLRAGGPYDQARSVVVDFNVKDGRVEATVRPAPPNTYQQRWALFLFDHETMTVREIPVELPNYLAPGDPPRTIVVDALAGRQVLVQAKAPDGYELESNSRRGPGLVGDLFGMHRYDQDSSLVNRGRVIPIALPPPYEHQSPVYAVGWLADGGQR